MPDIDQTHVAGRRSWVASANGHADFPIQNLPLGVFSPPGSGPRGGIAIGKSILDLAALSGSGLLRGQAAEAAQAGAAATLNGLLGRGHSPRAALRHAVAELLDAAAPPRPHLLHAAADCTLHLPAAIGDYTDFFAGLQHATNTGRMLRPDQPLTPNYKHVPLAYHGRASSVVASGTPVVRPNGQRKPARDDAPSFGPSRNLDYEAELGIWIGPGNALGTPIPIAGAGAHVAGYCLLNDWSARDVQGWEAQPIGPFLAKSFVTTVSPWIVTPEALAPFLTEPWPRGEGDPQPLPYLRETHPQALAVTLEVWLRTPAMATAHRLSAVDARNLYWTPAQMVAHHASGGCNLRPGDLFGSGTISGAERESWGSILELSRGGREPVTLPSGETRRFLEDGDEVTLVGRAVRDGFAPIGFGPCVGVVTPAVSPAPG